MGVPEQEKLSVERFFQAIAGRDGQFELVDGVAYAMAGAKQGHNVISSNVQTALVPAGKRWGCRTTSSDTGVMTGPLTVRFPDVVVDCGPADASALTASAPSVIVEVSSPGTAVFDYGEKLEEHKRLPSVQLILQIESEIVLVKAHRREAQGWVETLYESLDDIIEVGPLQTSIRMAEIYDTLTVSPRAKLQVVPR